jgi:arsenate reductase (glutaredoxin)
MKTQSPLTVYTYAKCSTCRDATRWLREHHVAFVEKPIRETPPTLSEARAMLAHQQGQLRKLFNTSGIEYRAQNLAEKLPQLSETEALKLLTSDGRLVKRPFVLGAGVGLVGFDEKKWAAALTEG